LQKSEGFRVKRSIKEKLKIKASSRKAGASEGEVVPRTRGTSNPQQRRIWRPPAFPPGKQHGKIDPILRIHQWRYPRICHFAM